jgi:hypothetical protein
MCTESHSINNIYDFAIEVGERSSKKNEAVDMEMQSLRALSQRINMDS